MKPETFEKLEGYAADLVKNGELSPADASELMESLRGQAFRRSGAPAQETAKGEALYEGVDTSDAFRR
ncbi:MAG: hypothetical protein PW734_07610 [Verrucomicrobium sp.]|nr:hypothetical protein [Verrucomicrobium sp.]